MSGEQEPKTGVVLDDSVELSLSEVCRASHVHAEVVIQLVEIGVLEPRGREPAEWRFTGEAIIVVRRAENLRRDLDINLPGVALALDLLDEIDRLRDRVNRLEGD